MKINRRNFLLSSLAAGSINLSNASAKENYSNIKAKDKVIDFDAKNIAKKYIKLYEELLDRKY